MTGILGVKPGHDGAIAYIREGNLEFSLEGEKDSFPRYSPLTADVVRLAAERLEESPSAVAWGGWFKYLPGFDSRVGYGYHGLTPGLAADTRFFGQAVRSLHTSHERTHLFAGAAMSPEAPLENATILLWEGEVGAAYDWSNWGRSIVRHHILKAPGGRYASLFGLAEPSFPDSGEDPPAEAAGKLMALAAFGDGASTTEAERRTIDELLSMEYVYPFDKARFEGSPLFNCGVRSEQLCRSARYMTDRLFDLFLDGVVDAGLGGRHLVLTGGCALNCEWNTRFRESGHFDGVSVSPCPNDSGSAIGAAVDAMVTLYEEPPKLNWSVYAGSEFLWDVGVPRPWMERPLNLGQLSELIAKGCVVAWVEGRSEIGPRALGHRSLIADAGSSSIRDRLNDIKGRESYRPVAPICLEGDLDLWFESTVPDEHMLFFSRVLSNELPAITHVDGTARVQSVTNKTGIIQQLLREYRDRTGRAVLCNTSLNFPGHGFINRSSELFAYCDLRGVDQIVTDQRWFSRGGSA